MPETTKTPVKFGDRTPADDAKIFRVFSSPTVCEVVAVLNEAKSTKGATVIEIKERLGLNNQAGKVSVALKSLEGIGVVAPTREGKYIRYSLVYTRNLPWTVRRSVETVIGKRS